MGDFDQFTKAPQCVAKRIFQLLRKSCKYTKNTSGAPLSNGANFTNENEQAQSMQKSPWGVTKVITVFVYDAGPISYDIKERHQGVGVARSIQHVTDMHYIPMSR